MADPFASFQPTIDGPAENAFAIGTADYGSALSTAARALYVGTGGSVVVETVGGGEVTFTNVADGSFLPVRAAAIGTATDATDLVGLV